MKILIVGSRGFLGRAFMTRMKFLGHDIQELNRTEVSSGFFDLPRVKATLESNFFDCVISFAWITSSADYRTSDENKSFRDATINLAIQSKINLVPHFVGIGSAAEYGNQNLNCDSSTSPLIKSDAYSSAKIETFHELTRIFGKKNFTWARVFQPYGAGQDRNRFLPYLINAQLSNLEATVKDPNYTCDWISSEDVASGLFQLISDHLFGAYDIGTGIATTNWELAELVGFKRAVNLDLSLSKGLVVSPNSPIFHSGWKPEKKLKNEIKSMLHFENT
jgi:nucleoside-diphosphate-sugar epimerase